MRKSRSILSSLLLVLATTGGALPLACAGENAPEGSSAYRLRTENPGIFQLTGPEPILAAETPLPAAVPRLTDRPYAELIEQAAREARLDPALVHAVIHVESRYNPAARSPKGALGLMQVLPETASRYGVADATRSVQLNLRVGTRYLRDLMSLFGDRVDLALAAYNAGERAVLRYGERIPPYPETQAYVPAVLDRYREWREPPPPVPQAPAAPTRIQYLPGTVLDLGLKAYELR